MLEVKGDFCHDIRPILTEAGREKDYIELGMEGRWQWNPLSAWWLDSYSLAYTVSSLLNQLFGKGKEPFWQQAYTNLVRWIIELHRALQREGPVGQPPVEIDAQRRALHGLQDIQIQRHGEAADLLQALNTGHGGSLTTVHANNAESALSRIASCAVQGGGELPWEVTCRGVVDGIAMVIHMTRREGRRFVEEAAYVKGYDAKENSWEIERLERISLK